MISCSTCGKEFPLEERYCVDFEEEESGQGLVKYAMDFCSENCYKLYLEDKDR